MYFVQKCLVEREINDMLVKDKDELHQHMFEISDSVSSDSKFNQDNYFNNIKRPLLNNMNFIFNNKSIKIKCEDFDNQNHYFNNISMFFQRQHMPTKITLNKRIFCERVTKIKLTRDF